MRRRLTEAAWVGLLSGSGLVVRAIVGFNSGIWADEGFFFLVVKIPSWSGMLDFLQGHESHPPLFYALMRLWMSVFGQGDVAALCLPLLLGALVVPSVYYAARSLFTKHTAFLAAGLAAVSPALVEHSAQLRPYGLLTLATIGSCYFMVTALACGGAHRWSLYVLSTVVMLYTHNWAWLVVGGEQIAVVFVVIWTLPHIWKRLARHWLLAWLAIGLAYLPWVATFVFQAKNAGHPSLAFDGALPILQLVGFGVFTAVQTFLIGSLANRELVAVSAFATGLLAAVLTLIVNQPSRDPQIATTIDEEQDIVAKFAIRAFVGVVVSAVGLAMAFSPRSNLLLERCLACLTPLVLVVFSQWCIYKWRRRGEVRAAATVASAFLGFTVTLWAFELASLATTPRSNARETAAVIARNMRPSDLLIVGPEWYAPSFNHYFRPSIEQIDFPYDSRSGLIDFSNVWERTADPGPLARITPRIMLARKTRRRVWVVTGKAYLRSLTPEELRSAIEHRQAGPMSTFWLGHVRDLLGQIYRRADSSVVKTGKPARSDNLHVYLYTP